VRDHASCSDTTRCDIDVFRQFFCTIYGAAGNQLIVRMSRDGCDDVMSRT
jgi:hypothetical protein